MAGRDREGFSVKEKHRIRCFSFVIMEVRRTGAAGCPGGCGRPGKPGSGRGPGRKRRTAPSATAITKFAEEPKSTGTDGEGGSG
jgi:hypothetical protein